MEIMAILKFIMNRKCENGERSIGIIKNAAMPKSKSYVEDS